MLVDCMVFRLGDEVRICCLGTIYRNSKGNNLIIITLVKWNGIYIFITIYTVYMYYIYSIYITIYILLYIYHYIYIVITSVSVGI